MKTANKNGRILAVKWGYNPNSSSLGVDVTFFLLGASALAVLTPVVAGLLYWRRLHDGPPSLDTGMGTQHDLDGASSRTDYEAP